MAIQDDFSVAVNGDIRYTAGAHGTGTATYYPIIQLHRYLQDLADDAVASGDDLLDITNSTPSDRSTDNIINLINGYNIDQATSEHLYDGTIVQAGGDERWDGLVVLAGEGVDVQIQQNGAMVANDFWNTVPDGEATKGLNRDVANGIAMRFMIQVRTGGADIDGRRLIGQTRETGFTYSEFRIAGGTAQGNNALPLNYAADLNDTTDASSRTEITNLTEGYVDIDVNNDAAPEQYYSQWNRHTYSINQYYERMKYITRRGTAETLYGLNGEVFRGITHEITLTGSGTGNWVEPESISWPGGTGQLLACDDTTGTDTTKIWMQLLTGVPPVNTDVITGNGGATGTTSSTAERVVATPFVGQSTGSALIGSYGLGLEATDLGAADKVFDLDNVQRVPPNYVSFAVGGLVSGEDRVLVGPANGNALRNDQCQTNALLSGGEATVVLASNTETIGTSQPSALDTPASGTIRIADNAGVFHRVTYTGFTAGAGTLTFTGCVGVPAAAANNAAYISYIDDTAGASSINFSAIYDSDRSLFIRVRDGGGSPIKTFQSTGTLGSSGGSVTAIRTTDA